VNRSEALSGRAGADGVRWALLAPPLRQVLRQELRGLLADPGALGACRLHRAKFKPGRKLSAWYEVGLNQDDQGHGHGPRGASRQIAVTWTVPADATTRGRSAGDAAADRAADGAALRMQAAASADGLAAPFNLLEAERPELGMRVLVSPLDTSHPQLVRVSDPRHVREMLLAAEATAAAGAGPGAAALRPAPAYAVRAVRYRPGQRHVLRYDPLPSAGGGAGGGAAGTARGPAVFAKLYRDGDGARAFRVAEQIAALLPPGDGGVTAARPLAYLPDDDVVLYGEVPGEPLVRRLGRPGGSAVLARHLARAGAALRALQGTAPPPAAEVDLPSFGLRRELRSIARAAEHVGPMLPAAGARVVALLDRAAALDERLPREAPGLAHGDYKADHLWVAPGGHSLTLIDFNTCSLAEPALDLGKFLADLHWWYAATPRPSLEWAQRQFLDGYAAAGRAPVPPERLRRARLYEALVLTKIIAHRVPVFDPAWRPRTTALLGRVDEVLAALEGGAGVRAG